MSIEVSKIIRNFIEYKKCIFNGNEWEVSPAGPPANEIWYTSSDGNIVKPYKTSSLSEIDTNTYSDGKGVIKFKTDITWKGDDAFYNCTKLTSIEIPDSVTSIGNGTFNGCSSLTSVTIPNGVTSIGSNTFNACAKLTSIEIPNSVTSIEMYAFAGCSSLTSVTIPNNTTSIGYGAFNRCRSLSSMMIPNSVTIIQTGAFWWCSGLTSIIVENGNTVYDSRNNCNALIETKTNTLIAGCQNTIIPNSVTSIGQNAFSGCSGLTSITIPNSVTSIAVAFDECSGLTSIVVENGNTVYDSRNNCNAIIKTDTNTLIAGCQNTTIPNSVTSIGDYAFSGCTGLTSVTIPNNVISIGDHAFLSCTGLTSIVIPNSVTSIGEGAFANCSSLTGIIIPNSVTSIGNGAFGTISAKIIFNKLYSIYTHKIFVAPSESYTYNVEFNISEIPTDYNISSMLPKIADDGKGTITYNIYTDYASCKDQALALVTKKTIVNVYHIDGAPWE